MFAAIIVVPCFMYKGLTSNTFEWSEIGKITLGVSEGFGAMGIVSAIAWGLGYFGQPHILTRFMAIKSSKDIKPARRIAMVWVIVSLAMAVLVGILASPYIQYMFKTGQITDPSSLSILNANGMLEGSKYTESIYGTCTEYVPDSDCGIVAFGCTWRLLCQQPIHSFLLRHHHSHRIYTTRFSTRMLRKRHCLT